MNTKLTIQEKLKDLRVERHLTLEQLAEETGISKSALGKYVRTLELAQVREEDYFAHVVHKDIDGILQDIREAHRKGTTTADTASPVTEIQKQMEAAMHYEGTEEEKNARLFLATLGIDYDKLTPEEFVTQINILKKSEHLKSPNNQRGKAVPYQVHGKGNRKRRK